MIENNCQINNNCYKSDNMELDKFIQFLHTNPQMQEMVLTQFKTMLPDVLAEDDARDEAEVEYDGELSRFVTPRCQAEVSLQTTNRLNQSSLAGGPSSRPELLLEDMVTLRPRVVDPIRSILVPEQENEELEVAHTLTHLGEAPWEHYSSFPGYDIPSSSVEFYPGLAGVNPFRPRAFAGEPEATSRIMELGLEGSHATSGTRNATRVTRNRA